MKKMKFEEICRNWGIDPQKNRHHFEWLKSDPRDEQGRLTRELGIREKGGEVIRLQRHHPQGSCIFYDLDGHLFPTGYKPTVSAMDFYF